jgi:hypothetical protein
MKKKLEQHSERHLMRCVDANEEAEDFSNYIQMAPLMTFKSQMTVIFNFLASSPLQVNKSDRCCTVCSDFIADIDTHRQFRIIPLLRFSARVAVDEITSVDNFSVTTFHSISLSLRFMTSSTP